MLNEKDSEIIAIAPVGPVGVSSQSKYDRLIARAKEVPAATTIVVHPCDEPSLRGPTEAAEAGIIVPILVGPAARITAVARKHKIDIQVSRAAPLWSSLSKIAASGLGPRLRDHTVVPRVRRARLGQRIFECVRRIGT